MAKRNRNPDSIDTEERMQKRQRIEDCLKCPVCLNWNKQPIVLSCGHALCQTCFGHESMNRDKCPLCRASVKSVHTACYPLRNLALMFAADENSDSSGQTHQQQQQEKKRLASPRQQAVEFTFSAAAAAAEPSSSPFNPVSMIDRVQDYCALILAQKAAKRIPMSLWSRGIYIWFPTSNASSRAMVEKFAFYMHAKYGLDVTVHKTHLLCSIRSRSSFGSQTSQSSLKESIAVLVHADASFSTHQVDAPFLTDENHLSEFEISRFVHKQPLVAAVQ